VGVEDVDVAAAQQPHERPPRGEVAPVAPVQLDDLDALGLQPGDDPGLPREVGAALGDLPVEDERAPEARRVQALDQLDRERLGTAGLGDEVDQRDDVNRSRGGAHRGLARGHEQPHRSGVLCAKVYALAMRCLTSGLAFVARCLAEACLAATFLAAAFLTATRAAVALAETATQWRTLWPERVRVVVHL